MKTVLAKISYFGPSFSGFARQPEALTVQGNIEDALKVLFGREVLSVCAGRTDAGVHANANYITFQISDEEALDERFNSSKLQESMDALTHDDIHVRSVEIIDGEFSARFDAKSRRYSYFICNQKTPSIALRESSWHVRKHLDVAAMQEAANYLIGEHDFKSFCVAKSSEKLDSTSRYISSIEIVEQKLFTDNIIELKVEGNAFLHSMVRTIVGSLVMIGSGQRPVNWMQEVLHAKDRQAAGQNAPACGLFLMGVKY